MANLGTDLGDFGPVEVEITGRELLVADLCWRLRTPEGTLFTDRSYGYALAQYLNDSLDAARLPAIATRIQLEFLKDDRVRQANAACELEHIDATKRRLRVTCDVTDADGPFRFIVAVTSDSFTLESLWP